MQGKRNSNAQISNRKATGSRMGTQQNQPQSHPTNQQNTQNNSNSLKERDEVLASIVKEYLEKCGYPRTLQTFKGEKPVKRIMPSGVSGKQIFSGYGSS